MELFERASELERLETHFRLASAGQGRGVFVAGEAGAGKTSLVDAFSQRITEQATVLRFSCDALSTPGPLGPVRDLAGMLGLTIDARAPGSDVREHLFRDILAALAARAGPTVIVGEDAHWADGATLELLRFLGRRVGALRALAIITYRDDELGSTHPLRVVLGDLATAPTVHRMRLAPLSLQAVQQMVVGSGRDAVALHRLTAGNPFFLTEILASEGGNVPASVEDAVLARASRLSPQARAVLDIAAVIGATCDLHVLQRIAGPVLDEIDACITRGLLHGTDAGLAFRHELARQAILAAIAPPRRQNLHGRVLATLRELPETQRDLARMAHHAEAASDREAAFTFAIAAAEEATVLMANREAAAQYARALRFSAGLTAPERASLLERRSMACYLSDQGEEAITARQEAVEIWRKLGSGLREGESLRWLSHFSWLEGRGQDAATAATGALALLHRFQPGPELAMAYSNLAQLRMLDHDLEETQRWGQQAISLAEQLGETEIHIHALTNVSSAHYYAGDERGREDLCRSRDLAIAAGLIEHAARAANNLAWMTLLGMRLPEADREFAAAIAYVVEHDLDTHHRYMLAGRATLRMHQGDWEAAEAESRFLLMQPTLSSITRCFALTTLGLVQARRGDAEAAGTLDEALALAERAGQLLRLGPVRAARAEMALLAGDPIRARAEALAVSEMVFAHGNRWLRGEYAWLLWQAGERAIATSDLAQPYARLIAGDFAGAAGDWRELGCPYEEARALAESDVPELVRRAVEMFERLGAEPARRRAIHRLRELGAGDLPPVRRGPRAATRAHPAGLTQREAEVLQLLADGVGTADIATRLYMAPKTVRHHVSAILAKLGVETRAEAVRAATKRGIVSL